MSQPENNDTQSLRPERGVIAILIKAMLWIAVLAVAYVILKSCSTPKLIEGENRLSQIERIEQMRRGALAKLEIKRPAPVPPVTVFQNELGQDVTLSDWDGQLVLVNLWATWCAPCVAEIPSLNALQGRYDKSEFEVVAISLDGSAEDADEFLQAIGADNLELYHEPSYAFAKASGAAGVPVSILYDGQGDEVARLSGEADWNSAQAAALINMLLGEADSPRE